VTIDGFIERALRGTEADAHGVSRRNATAGRRDEHPTDATSSGSVARLRESTWCRWTAARPVTCAQQ
jgi:hypothetical protein